MLQKLLIPTVEISSPRGHFGISPGLFKMSFVDGVWIVGCFSRCSTGGQRSSASIYYVKQVYLG